MQQRGNYPKKLLNSQVNSLYNTINNDYHNEILLIYEQFSILLNPSAKSQFDDLNLINITIF